MTWMSHTRGRLGKLGVLKRSLLLKRSGMLSQEKSKTLGAMQRTVPMAYRPTPGNLRTDGGTMPSLRYAEDAFVRSLLMRTSGSADIRVNLTRGEPHALQRIVRRQMELMAAEEEARLRDPGAASAVAGVGPPRQARARQRQEEEEQQLPWGGAGREAPEASSVMARRAQRRAVEEFWAQGMRVKWRGKGAARGDAVWSQPLARWARNALEEAQAKEEVVYRDAIKREWRRIRLRDEAREARSKVVNAPGVRRARGRKVSAKLAKQAEKERGGFTADMTMAEAMAALQGDSDFRLDKMSEEDEDEHSIHDEDSEWTKLSKESYKAFGRQVSDADDDALLSSEGIELLSPPNGVGEENTGGDPTRLSARGAVAAGAGDTGAPEEECARAEVAGAEGGEEEETEKREEDPRAYEGWWLPGPDPDPLEGEAWPVLGGVRGLGKKRLKGEVPLARRPEPADHRQGSIVEQRERKMVDKHGRKIKWTKEREEEYQQEKWLERDEEIQALEDRLEAYKDAPFAGESTDWGRKLERQVQADVLSDSGLFHQSGGDVDAIISGATHQLGLDGHPMQLVKEHRQIGAKVTDKKTGLSFWRKPSYAIWQARDEASVAAREDERMDDKMVADAIKWNRSRHRVRMDVVEDFSQEDERGENLDNYIDEWEEEWEAKLDRRINEMLDAKQQAHKENKVKVREEHRLAHEAKRRGISKAQVRKEAKLLGQDPDSRVKAMAKKREPKLTRAQKWARRVARGDKRPRHEGQEKTYY